MFPKIKKFNLLPLLFIMLFISAGIFTNCSDSSSSDPAVTPADETITEETTTDDGNDVPDLTVTAPQALDVSISGILQSAKTLTGDYTYFDLEGDSEGNSAYRWLVSDTSDGIFSEISGAIALDYVLTSDDIGKYLKFAVTPAALTGEELTGTTAESSVYGPVIEIQTPYATDVRITGILQDTQTLSGNYVYNDAQGDLEAASTYKWFTSSSSGGPFDEIALAASSTYAIQTADVGKYIIFEVTPVTSTAEYAAGDPVRSAACGPIVTADAPYATNVNITGTLAVDAALTGNYIYNDNETDAEGISTFKWYRGDTESGAYIEIVSANSDTYILQEEDRGKYIIFEVTPVAQTGTVLGAPVKSVPKGPIKGFANITVDGEIDEADWTSADSIYFTDDQITEDGGEYNDIQNFYIAWDAENLYIGIKGGFGNNDVSNSVIVYIDTVYDGATGTEDFTFTGGTYANLDGIPVDTDFGYDHVWISSWGHQNAGDSGLYIRDNTTEIAAGINIAEDGTVKDAAEISIAWSAIGLETPGNNKWIAFIPVISYNSDGSSTSNWYDDTGLAAATSAFTVKITDGTGNLMKLWQ